LTARPLRFGIIGCGAIGPTHAGAIRQLGHVVAAVADPIEQRAAKVAERFEVECVCRDHVELLKRADLDAVCVCTPSGMHADHAVTALRAGRHVVIEKPMDITPAACDRIIDQAARSGKVLTVISQHRFDAATQVARGLIQAGQIGRIILANADIRWFRTQHYYDEGEWRGTWRLDGGGALMNQGIHTLDLLQWLAGGVKKVWARTATAAHERIEVEDIAVLSLEFGGGAIGSLVATTAAYDGFPNRIEIFGTEGSILIEGDNLRRVVLKSGQTFETQSAAEHALRVARGGTASVRDDAVERTTAPPGAVWGDAHRAQIEDFVLAIQGERTVLIDGSEGRAPVAVACAAYESARTGREIIVDQSDAARPRGQ